MCIFFFFFFFVFRAAPLNYLRTGIEAQSLSVLDIGIDGVIECSESERNYEKKGE